VIFSKKLLEFDPIYDSHIGVVLTKSELNVFGETKKFKKLFAFKEFHEGFVHYFSSKFLRGCLDDE